MGQALKGHGYEVSIVSASWFHKYHSPPDVGKEGGQDVVDGLEYEWIKTRSYKGRGLGQVLNQWDYVHGAWMRANQLPEEGVRAVVASSPHPFVIYPAARYARRIGVPLIFETRDLWPEAIIELGGISRRHPYIRLLRMAERYVVRKADCIMSVKPGDERYFSERYHLTEERFAYVPNGFYESGQSAGASVPSLSLDADSRTTTVGYVGALSAYYQLDALLETAEKLKDNSAFCFIVVGGGDDEERLRRIATTRGLNNVELVGFRPKSEIPGWLETFDVCYLGLKDVSVNRYGISCNKLFEYMAAGKPVVASYKTDFDPVAMGKCGITVAPGDTDALVHAITRLSDDPALARELGDNGRRYFLENHEFSVVARKFLDVVDSLQQSRGQSSCSRPA